MKTMNKFATVLGVVGVLTLGGCGTMNDPFNTSGSGTSNPEVVNSGNNAYAGYGVVQSIDLVQQGTAGSTGIGGTGIGIGTIAGAAGGAYVGHEIDNRTQQQRTADVYRFTVRMDSGSYQTLTQNTNGGFRVGDRVRIDNGIVQRM